MSVATARQRWRVDDVRRKIAGRDLLACPEQGDFTFNRDLEPLIRHGATKDAAVLIGLIDGDEPALLLTERSKALRTHAGQVAFPGGRIDPDDDSPAAAAIRECEEEIGVGVANIAILGQLPVYLSGSGYRITPVVAAFTGDYVICPNPDEVEHVFTVPLGFVLDQTNHQLSSRQWQGQTRRYYEMPFAEHYIWGVTAGIIRLFYETLHHDG